LLWRLRVQPRAFLPFVDPQQLGRSADSAFDPACFDFTAYMGRRLGVEPPLAGEVLGAWLRNYEPTAAEDPLFDLVGPMLAAPSPSGVRTSEHTPVVLVETLTGTCN
jgi:hypothetical protein